MTDAPLVELVHTALVLQLGRAVVPIVPTQDEALPIGGLDAEGAPVAAFMNIVKSGRPPQVLAEAMGLDEDETEIEYVQTYNVEWIVRAADPAERRALFARGLAGIAAAVAADRTIGGLAHGLMIGEPQYDVNPLVGSPDTLACLVPLRAALRGVSLLA